MAGARRALGGDQWAITRTSRQKDRAAAFINYFVTNPEPGRILGVERGVPLSPAVRELILPGLDGVAQATVEYIDFIADKLGPIPPAVPRGANDFDRPVMRPTADLVAFGRLTPPQGAAKLVADGSAVIG